VNARCFDDLITSSRRDRPIDADSDATLAMLETLMVGLIEVSAEPDLHGAAARGFRSALQALVRS